MFIFDNENHVKTGQYGWHEVYVLATKRKIRMIKYRKGNLQKTTKKNGIVKVASFLTSSPLVSSQRPKTEFAAASTEHLEFNVVVIPAYKS